MFLLNTSISADVNESMTRRVLPVGAAPSPALITVPGTLPSRSLHTLTSTPKDRVPASPIYDVPTPLLTPSTGAPGVSRTSTKEGDPMGLPARSALLPAPHDSRPAAGINNASRLPRPSSSSGIRRHHLTDAATESPAAVGHTVSSDKSASLAALRQVCEDVAGATQSVEQRRALSQVSTILGVIEHAPHSHDGMHRLFTLLGVAESGQLADTLESDQNLDDSVSRLHDSSESMVQRVFSWFERFKTDDMAVSVQSLATFRQGVEQMREEHQKQLEDLKLKMREANHAHDQCRNNAILSGLRVDELMEDLERERSDSKDAIARLSSEKESALERFREADLDRVDLRAEIARLSDIERAMSLEIKSLQMSMEESTREKSALREELKMAVEEKVKAEMDAARVRTDLREDLERQRQDLSADASTRLAEKDALIDQLRREMNDLAAHMARNSGEIRRLESEHSSMSVENHQYAERLTAQSEQLSTLTDSLHNAQQEIREVFLQKDAIDVDLKKSQMLLGEARNTITELTGQLQEATSARDKATREHALMSERVEALKLDDVALAEELRSARERIESLGQSLAAVTRQRDGLEVTMEDRERDLVTIRTAYEQDTATLRVEMDRLRAENVSLVRAQDQSSRDLAAIQVTVDTLKAELGKQSELNVLLSQKHDDAMRRLEDARSGDLDLAAALRDCESDLDALDMVNGKLKLEAEEKSRELTQALRDQSEAQAKIERLQNSIAALEADLQREKELAAAQTQRNASQAQAEIERLQNSIAALEADLQREKELAAAQTQRNASQAQAEIERLQNSIAALEDDLQREKERAMSYKTQLEASTKAHAASAHELRDRIDQLGAQLDASLQSCALAKEEARTHRMLATASQTELDQQHLAFAEARESAATHAEQARSQTERLRQDLAHAHAAAEKQAQYSEELQERIRQLEADTQKQHALLESRLRSAEARHGEKLEEMRAAFSEESSTSLAELEKRFERAQAAQLESNRELVRTRTQLAALKQEHEQLRIDVESMTLLEQENKRLHEQLNSLAAEKRRSGQLLSEGESALRLREDELARLREELSLARQGASEEHRILLRKDQQVQHTLSLAESQKRALEQELRSEKMRNKELQVELDLVKRKLDTAEMVIGEADHTAQERIRSLQKEVDSLQLDLERAEAQCKQYMDDAMAWQQKVADGAARVLTERDEWADQRARLYAHAEETQSKFAELRGQTENLLAEQSLWWRERQDLMERVSTAERAVADWKILHQNACAERDAIVRELSSVSSSAHSVGEHAERSEGLLQRAKSLVAALQQADSVKERDAEAMNAAVDRCMTSARDAGDQLRAWMHRERILEDDLGALREQNQRLVKELEEARRSMAVYQQQREDQERQQRRQEQRARIASGAERLAASGQLSHSGLHGSGGASAVSGSTGSIMGLLSDLSARLAALESQSAGLHESILSEDGGAASRGLPSSKSQGKSTRRSGSEERVEHGGEDAVEALTLFMNELRSQRVLLETAVQQIRALGPRDEHGLSGRRKPGRMHQNEPNDHSAVIAGDGTTASVALLRQELVHCQEQLAREQERCRRAEDRCRTLTALHEKTQRELMEQTDVLRTAILARHSAGAASGEGSRSVGEDGSSREMQQLRRELARLRAVVDGNQVTMRAAARTKESTFPSGRVEGLLAPDRDMLELHREVVRLRDELRRARAESLEGRGGTDGEAQWLKARLARVETMRRSLVLQKRYLMLTLGRFENGERECVAYIARLGLAEARRQSALGGRGRRARYRLRAALWAVLVMVRTRRLARSWRAVQQRHQSGRALV
jgi:chromosome segregation ATPase